MHTNNTLPIPGIANSNEFTTTLEETVEGIKVDYKVIYLCLFAAAPHVKECNRVVSFRFIIIYSVPRNASAFDKRTTIWGSGDSKKWPITYETKCQYIVLCPQGRVFLVHSRQNLN